LSEKPAAIKSATKEEKTKKRRWEWIAGNYASEGHPDKAVTKEHHLQRIRPSLRGRAGPAKEEKAEKIKGRRTVLS